MRERAPQRPAASAPRRAPTTPPRRGGTNAGKGSRQTRSSAQRPRGSRSYNTPAVWTKEAPRSNLAGGAARRALGAVGGVLLSLLALVGKGLATLFRALAALVARSRIALAVVFVCAALLVFGVADFAVNANKAYPGVRVGQIDAAGKTADELAALIDEVYGARLAQGSVTIYANDEAEARIADETAAAQDAALAEQLALGGGARQQACLDGRRGLARGARSFR